MKKALAVLLAIAMLMSLAACTDGDGTGENRVITRKTSDAAITEAETTDGGSQSGVSKSSRVAYVFVTPEGVQLTPGQAFDASKLPEPQTTYQAPSCAIDGTDNVYNYGSYEVTAFDEGNGEFVYSVYFVQPDIATPEGLSLGDEVYRADQLYGTDYTAEANGRSYTVGETRLQLIIENDTVTGIEYLLVR